MNFRSFVHGPQKLLLLVDADEAENILGQIKAYCLRYPFWRYFEDADVVLGSSLKPELRFIPMSPMAIETWAATESKVEEVEIVAAQKKGKRKVITDSFFHPGNEQSM